MLCLSEYIDLSWVDVGDRMLTVKDNKRKEKIYEILKNAIEKDNHDVKIYTKEVINSISILEIHYPNASFIQKHYHEFISITSLF